MTIRTEYAPKGLIGVLTPQANTTVEPEFAILCPAGYGIINARLTSQKAGMEDRLRDYGANIEAEIGQFNNAPIGAVALAVTGVSYLLGREVEDELVSRIAASGRPPLVTTALAVCDALHQLQVGKIALLSPYPESLTAKSAAYWTSRGFEVGEICQLQPDPDTFHPIYAMTSQMAEAALDDMQTTDADAILMLGTGLPTLAPLAARAGWDGPPVLSTMFCLVWRSVLAASEQTPDRDSLDHWRDRLAQQMKDLT